MENEYVIEMLNITKEFPGIKANDNITLQLRRERFMHCLVRMVQVYPYEYCLFGLYQPTSGTIKRTGRVITDQYAERRE